MNARPHGASVVPSVATTTSIPWRVDRHARHDQPVRGRAPVRMGEHAGDDVGDEDRAEREQDVLDAAERAAQHEHARRRPRRRDAHVAARAGEQLHPGRDAGELGADRADVRDHERARARPPPRARRSARGRAASGPCRSRRPCAPPARGRRSAPRSRARAPTAAVAVVGAEDRVRRDPGRVVVGEPGEQARAEHGQQRHQRRAVPAQAREPAMRMADREVWRAGRVRRAMRAGS